MKAIILYISLLFVIASQSVNAQNLNAQYRVEAEFPNCITNGFYGACSTEITPCPTWTDDCGDGWIRSHGTPNLVAYTETSGGTTINRFYAFMWDEGSNGEGMFRGYPFKANTTYEINLTFFSWVISGNGVVEIFAANGLEQGEYKNFGNGNSCGSGIPSISSKQQIGQYEGTTGGDLQWVNMTFTFTANANYDQIWIYPDRTDGDQQYRLGVKDIKICRSCNGIITYNKGDVPVGTTRSGTIKAGSSAGIFGFGTVTVDGTATTDFLAANEVDLEHEFEATVTTGTFSAEIFQCSTGTARVNTGTTMTGGIPPKYDLPIVATVNEERKLDVYPTVNKGQINITGDLSALENVELAVYDLTGRKIIQLPKKSYPGKATINLGNLNNGTYLLQIKQKDNSTTKKIIIQK